MTPASVAKMAESPTASASASAARRVSTFVPSAIKEPTWLHGSWVPQQQTSSSGSNCFNLLASSSTDSDEDLKDLEWDVQKMTFGVGELDDRTDAPLCKIFYTIRDRGSSLADGKVEEIPAEADGVWGLQQTVRETFLFTNLEMNKCLPFSVAFLINKSSDDSFSLRILAKEKATSTIQEEGCGEGENTTGSTAEKKQDETISATTVLSNYVPTKQVATFTRVKE